ncbi:SDR family oxidoreductase [Hyphomonas sp.]|uniref:SDR family oxidoreductase n=1 Tax=Hyphomonas sp. TaxID=87 RepID=UPI003F6F58D4
MTSGLSDHALDSAPIHLAEGLFSGRTILVTGAGSGIGKAAAWLLAKLNAQIVTCGRSAEKLTALETAFSERDWPLLAVQADIRDQGAVEQLMDKANKRFGGIDCLVNNAGGQFAQRALDFTANGWRAVIDNNLTGPWFVMQSAARNWIRQSKPGVIVNITASNSRGMPGIAHSSSARAGIENLTRTLAIEWAEYRIRTNCLALGLIETAGLDVYPEAARNLFPDANPMRTLGSPWHVAHMIALMASDMSAFMTGQTVTLDGGASCWGDLWTIDRPDYFESTSANGSDPDD